MTETYGVISDVHGVNINLVSRAFDYLKNEEVDGVVLNGDIIGERSGINPINYFTKVLEIAKKSDLKTYVLPGSHEEVKIFEPIIEHFSNKYDSIINTLKIPKIEKKEFDLVFLPGSDWRAGNARDQGYSLETENNSGLYKNEKDEYLRVINMHCLEELVTNPDKTVLFSHVPAKFNVPETVDVAKFYETKENFKFGHDICEAGSVFPEPVGYNLLIQGAPVEFKEENRGNEKLKRIFEEVGITKNITGHFHESAGNANDLKNEKVKPKKYNSELFLNASCLDNRILSVVSIDEDNISYTVEKI